MAWTASGMHREFLSDILDQTCTTLDMDAASMFRVALYDNSVTPNYDATDLVSCYAGASSTWVSTGGASGAAQVFTTGWAQHGPLLASNDITQVAGGIVKFSATDQASSSGTTMSGIYGCLIYADAVAAPANSVKQGVVAVYFGGTSYSVTNGTFTIQWNASGIFTIDIA